MKKIFLIAAFFFLGLILVYPSTVSAFMMGQRGFNQNIKNISNCSADDSYFEKLGDQMMEKMMGEKQDKLMEERMGEELSKVMHIRMGKMVSGCLTSTGQGLNNPTAWPMMGMMGWGQGMMGSWSWLFAGYWLVVSLLFLVILILLTVFLWKKINHQVKKN